MDIKKEKYDLFFRLSFVSYVLIIYASPYVTAQIWADLIMLFFIIALIYQFIYVFFLRKKREKNISKVFLEFFIYAITSVSVYILVWYIDIFFNGYTPTDWVGNSISAPYYGIQAILESDWENLFYVPYLIFNVLIIIVYKLVNRKLKK